jgi:hypothetical protein
MENWQNATDMENYSTGSNTCPSAPAFTTIPMWDQTQLPAVKGNNLKLELSHGILFNSHMCFDAYGST